jgi:hypothetical protein
MKTAITQKIDFLTRCTQAAGDEVEARINGAFTAHEHWRNQECLPEKRARRNRRTRSSSTMPAAPEADYRGGRKIEERAADGAEGASSNAVNLDSSAARSQTEASTAQSLTKILVGAAGVPRGLGGSPEHRGPEQGTRRSGVGGMSLGSTISSASFEGDCIWASGTAGTPAEWPPRDPCDPSTT